MKPYPKFQVVLSVNEKADDVKSLDQLLKILDEAIANNHPESITIKRILDFLDNLTDYKLELLINNIGDNLKLILNNAKGLSSLQKNRYKKII
jgi:lipopolysaccharide biosynthesis protein